MTNQHERLISVAFKREGHKPWAGGTSHKLLRQSVDGGTGATKEGDIDGFMTSRGRFLTRKEAIPVAIKAGQIGKQWETRAGRDLLSSDINW